MTKGDGSAYDSTKFTSFSSSDGSFGVFTSDSLLIGTSEVLEITASNAVNINDSAQLTVSYVAFCPLATVTAPSPINDANYGISATSTAMTI